MSGKCISEMLEDPIRPSGKDSISLPCQPHKKPVQIRSKKSHYRPTCNSTAQKKYECDNCLKCTAE